MAMLAHVSLLLLACTVGHSRNNWCFSGSFFLTARIPSRILDDRWEDRGRLRVFSITKRQGLNTYSITLYRRNITLYRRNITLLSNCTEKFCEKCTSYEAAENCHYYCMEEDVVLSRRANYYDDDDEADCNGYKNAVSSGDYRAGITDGNDEDADTSRIGRCVSQCEFLDLPEEFTNVSRCDALKKLTNFQSDESFCPRAVVEDIVDGCVDEILNFTYLPEVQCSDFPLLQQDDVREFCSESRKNALLCGAFCRFDGPIVPKNCTGRRKDVCREFVERIQYVETEEEIELYSSSLFNFVEKVNLDTIGAGIRMMVESTKRRRGRLTNKASQNILNTFDVAFNESYAEQWMTPNISTTTEAFENINDTLLLIMESITNNTDDNSTFIFEGSNVALYVMKFLRGPSGSQFSFPTADQILNSSLLEQVNVTIPFTDSCDEADDFDDCYVTIGISIIDNFGDYITEAIEDRDDTPSGDRRETDSSLLSVVVINSEDSFSNFSTKPVKIRFMPQGNVSITDFQYGIHFLDPLFFWSTDGISIPTQSSGALEVTSNHLTSFAILASPTGATRSSIPLSIVTYVGCAISIICLIMTITILLIFRRKLKKGVLLYVHLNLSLALLLAMVVFIVGVDHASFNTEFCVFVAALVQYLFLCAFFWMLGEGVMLYLLIVRVFGNATKRWYLLLPICWGIPAIIVAVSAGVLHNEYIIQNGTESFCWINATPSKPAIWTFLVPLIIVICVNTVILVVTVYSIVKTRKVGSTEGSHSNRELVKTAVKGSLVLLPLLGLTWVFGLFAVSQNTSVFAWIFTVVNSLQGLFIFLVHVARNEYLLCILKKKLDSYSWTEKYRRMSIFSVKSLDSNGKSSDAHFSAESAHDANFWESRGSVSASESVFDTTSRKD